LNNNILLSIALTDDSPPLINKNLHNLLYENDWLISNLLLLHNSQKNLLFSINDKISHLNNLEFWTDGSLKTNNNGTTSLGYGWLLNPIILTNIEFNGSAKNFASSTKAECLAFLTCLIICPPNSTVTIHTDSLCLIQTYNNIFYNNLSHRKFLKINNYQIWNAIQICINKLNFTINLIKVKSHSNNMLNDKADTLANKSRFNPYLTLINQKALMIPITFIWNQNNTNISLDHDICKVTKTIILHRSFSKFLSHKPLKHISQNSFNLLIDWQWTKNFFHYNAFKRSTSLKLSKDTNYKIKNASFFLPTLDHMIMRYPKLFKNFTQCLHCNIEKETNEHLWNCPKVIELIKPISIKYEKILTNLLKMNGTQLIFDIDSTINHFKLFNWMRIVPHFIIEHSHSLYNFLHGFIPNDLTHFQNTY
jgi:ribonuclease HI